MEERPGLRAGWVQGWISTGTARFSSLPTLKIGFILSFQKRAAFDGQEHALDSDLFRWKTFALWASTEDVCRELDSLAKDPAQRGPVVEVMGGGAALGSAWVRGQPSGRVLELGRKSPTAVPVCPLPLSVLMIWRKLPSKAPAPGMALSGDRPPGGHLGGNVGLSVPLTLQIQYVQLGTYLPGSLLLQMAPARVRSYTRTIGPPGPSQHCFSCRLMALLCSLLSMLMVTAVACYSHHLLSWSKKRGSCCCFKKTVTPHHFPNEGETPELSLWEWLRYPGHTTQGPYPAWINHGANGRRCSAWISLGQGTAQ